MFRKQLFHNRKTAWKYTDIAIPKDTIRNILKGHKLVSVENQNDQYYNAALGEKGYLFLPANNNREVFLTVKGDPKMLGLRDRDYLKPEEIVAIKNKFPNLKILNYYAFENYAYHPDNLEELQKDGYNKTEYIQDTQTYVEFKEGTKNDEKIEQITDALQSDDFEVFYPYYNIKKHYSKALLQSYLIKDLVQTNWFKQQIEHILIK